MLATPEILAEGTQWDRLVQVLPTYLDEIPLYRNWSAQRLSVGNWTLEAFRKLPLITKADIRQNFPNNFLQPGVELEDLLDRELIELEHTSGTSEERTPLLLGRGWWTEQERRALLLNPFISRVLEEIPAPRRATLTSPVCSGDVCYTGVPSQAERVVGQTLFLSLSRLPWLWSEAELARMVAEAAEWAPVFLDVDPVYGTAFALYCEKNRIQLPSLRFIICSYEFVSLAHRQVLERVFRVPVFDLYGSTETGHLLMESEPGAMRPSAQTAFLELHNPDEHGVGELIVSTLTNEFMPLLRYRIGDLAKLEKRPYGNRYFVHGRAADSFYRSHGRVTVAGIDGCFAALPGFAHYQLCEVGENEFSLRFVADQNRPSPATQAELRQRLEHTLGDNARVQVQAVEFLMPENSGKFRLCYPNSR